MMKLTKRIGLAALCVVGINSVFAESGDTYVGIAYSMDTISNHVGSAYSPTSLSLKAGIYRNKTSAFEARYIMNLSEDKNVGVTGYEILQKDTFFAANETAFNTYGLLGFSQLTSSQSLSNITTSTDDFGFLFGLGFEGKLQHDISYYGEYIYILGSTEFDYTSIVVGVSKNF